VLSALAIYTLNLLDPETAKEVSSANTSKIEKVHTLWTNILRQTNIQKTT
jgi:hypothetical protein